MKILRKSEFIIVSVLLAVYLCIFAYLNLFCFRQHVDSDIAAESLLAREIWNQKTLTPDNWAGSTERYVFGMPAVAAPFYGITGSMSLATGIACVIIGAYFVVTMYLFFRWLGLHRGTAITALLILSALPMNGLENENQIVPFFALLMYVFADWYVMFFTLGVYSFWFYRYLKEKKEYRKSDIKLLIPAFILFCVAAILSAGGMHTVQIGIFPLFLYELIVLFFDTDQLKKLPSFKRLIPTFYVLSQMVAFGISTLHHGQVSYDTFVSSRDEVIRNVFSTIPSLVLKNFGFEGDVFLAGMDAFMNFMMIAFIILVVIALINVCGRKEIYADSSVQCSRLKEGLGFFACMFGVAAILMILADVGSFHYYLFAVWFVAALAVAIYVQKLINEKRGFADLIIGAVILFAIFNLKYTYSDAINCKDNLRSYEEVTDFMKSEGVYYGYAEFWDADRLAVVCDGELIFGCSYYMEDLGMYWWLTNTDWYPPTLPEDMKTAYVIRRGKETGFLAQFEDPGVVIEVFANDGFTVYFSDRNYVTKL